MKKLAAYIILFLYYGAVGQQLPQYTQYIFNKVGYSPAAAGASFQSPYEIIFGGRTEYIGLSNNPKSAFISGNYTFIPQRAYHNWHSVGAYIDQDRNGIFIDNSIYATYTYHQLISKNTVLAAGVHAGLKQFALNSTYLDKNDPAVAASSKSFLAYPDVIPGIRLYSKKFFMDFSLWQLVVNKEKGFFSSKQIGSPSRLPIHYIFSIGQKVSLPMENVFMASINLKGTFKFIPSIELNLMNYWNKRFAYGLSIRNRDFVCGIFQIRVVNNLVIGFAYDLSTNRMFRPATHTGEVMIGISPIFGNDTEKKARYAVDECAF